MIIIKIKDGENIERALKRFKRKINETKMVQELRKRKEFNKDSVIKREQNQKAKYIQKLKDKEEYQARQFKGLEHSFPKSKIWVRFPFRPQNYNTMDLYQRRNSKAAQEGSVVYKAPCGKTILQVVGINDFKEHLKNCVKCNEIKKHNTIIKGSRSI